MSAIIADYSFSSVLYPNATTNFSELSERLLGGLKLKTFLKRFLRIFCNSPSAPPARTLATKAPSNSRTCLLYTSDAADES